MQSRDRFLKPAEMPVLFEALSEESNEVVRDYTLISLLTGARKGNMFVMRSNEIDFDGTDLYKPLNSGYNVRRITDMTGITDPQAQLEFLDKFSTFI